MTADWSLSFPIEPAILGLMGKQNERDAPPRAKPTKRQPRNAVVQAHANQHNTAQMSVNGALSGVTSGAYLIASNDASGEALNETPILAPDTEDDATLVALLGKIMAGSEIAEQALARFYDATVNRVYGVAMRIVRTPEMAEEVVSDVYMQVWRDAYRYDASRGRVLAWVLIIARTRSLDLLRRQDEAFSHPDPHELVSEPTETKHDPLVQMIDRQHHRALHDAMLKLTPIQRQLLALAFFRGLSHSEIVESTAIPLGSVKTHIRRALMVLKDVLDAPGALYAMQDGTAVEKKTRKQK
jgi:RNA polymerase sigma factor (sigma-70 family)